MPSQIQPLASELIQAMAAGEVLDSWEAVVQELVENALDAQATRLQIGIHPQAQTLQISDNGWGMSREDLEVCCLPHRTSKIKSNTRFPAVQQLGFRGEALHSLVQMGRVTIASRLQTKAPGWGVTYNSAGKIQAIQTQAMAPGTTITIEHLFQAWPHRQQSPNLRRIQRIIQHIALCHPHLTWQVKLNDRAWFQMSPGGSAKETFLQILPQLQAGDLQRWHSSELELVVGLPDRYHRRRPDWVLLAINGRCVELKGDEGRQLQQTLLQAWQQTLPRHRFPLCFAHFHIPSPEIDWHCHPGKREVYLANAPAWQEKLTTALQAVITLPQPLPSLALDPVHNRQDLLTAHLQEPAAPYGLELQRIATSTPLGPQLTVLAQVHQTYILVEHPTGLWLVEQHIAHERVLYEQLLADWNLVQLPQPLTLERLSPKQLEQLESLGIVPEVFGPSLWLIRQAPHMLSQRGDLGAALIELSTTENLQAALVVTACRSAIRNGTSLGLGEMQTLIQQWQATQQPRTCPHGRPICLQLEEASLARFFRRHWVIGKSHGI